eukprot:scaffold97863_cov18-Prasinocladus_malaysianus.AAC.2
MIFYNGSRATQSPAWCEIMRATMACGGSGTYNCSRFDSGQSCYNVTTTLSSSGAFDTTGANELRLAAQFCKEPTRCKASTRNAYLTNNDIASVRSILSTYSDYCHHSYTSAPRISIKCLTAGVANGNIVRNHHPAHSSC